MQNNIKIATYNVRGDWINDGANSFIHRFGMIVDKIITEKPDICAFQEVTEPIAAFLERALPEYMLLGQFREADYRGEGLFTAVRKETFSLIAFESFWLSPTPYIAGSRYENQSDCPRICVVTELLHKKSGKLLRTFNIHLDHISDEARRLGMGCVLDFASKFNERINLPMIILGDFNAYPGDGVIKMADEYKGIRDVTKDIDVTFHNFGKDGVKIDYIYMSEMLADNVVKTEKWDDCYNGIYLSDHYPVCAEILFD